MCIHTYMYVYVSISKNFKIKRTQFQLLKAKVTKIFDTKSIFTYTQTNTRILHTKEKKC